MVGIRGAFRLLSQETNMARTIESKIHTSFKGRVMGVLRSDEAGEKGDNGGVGEHVGWW
jgi:hypothetical protein